MRNLESQETRRVSPACVIFGSVKDPPPPMLRFGAAALAPREITGTKSVGTSSIPTMTGDRTFDRISFTLNPPWTGDGNRPYQNSVGPEVDGRVTTGEGRRDQSRRALAQ